MYKHLIIGDPYWNINGKTELNNKERYSSDSVLPPKPHDVLTHAYQYPLAIKAYLKNPPERVHYL